LDFKHHNDKNGDMQDDNNSDDNFISKSELKRDAQEIHRLAEALVALKASDYNKAPLDEDMRAHLDLARRIDAQIAKKRQILYIAKQLRKRPEILPELFLAVDKPKSEMKKETARMHRLERWRERLIDEGDDALSEYLSAHPAADRQALRSLVRAATATRARAKAAIANDQPAPRNDGSFSALYKMLGDIEKSTGEAVQE
jgi:ribosome-associated protein